MALFGSKKNTAAKKSETKSEVKKVGTGNVPATLDLSSIIRRPRITEKASTKSADGIYTFEVSRESNKKTIAAAVKALYNVTPVRIAVVAIPKKEIIVRGRKGIRGGGKKAYVYLKKGETIEFV